MVSNNDTFYILEFYQKGKLTEQNKVFCCRYFRKFENAVACIAVPDIFECLPEELQATLGNPKIYCASRGNGIADDFRFRYQNGIVVYIGQILFEEDKAEEYLGE